MSERKHLSHGFKQSLKKSNDKSIGSDSESKSKAEKPEFKASIAKIQLYKKLRKEKRTESIVKKMAPVNRLPNSFEREVMFETELAPIKWKNFGHVGSH